MMNTYMYIYIVVEEAYNAFILMRISVHVSYIVEIDGRYVGIAGTGRSKSNDYDEVTGDDAYEMTGIVQPAGIVTSMHSDYDDIVDPHRSSNLVITNPSRMEPQHHELPQKRNIYSTMSDSSLLHASSYEEPVESGRVRIHALVKQYIPAISMRELNADLTCSAWPWVARISVSMLSVCMVAKHFWLHGFKLHYGAYHQADYHFTTLNSHSLCLIIPRNSFLTV